MLQPPCRNKNSRNKKNCMFKKCKQKPRIKTSWQDTVIPKTTRGKKVRHAKKCGRQQIPLTSVEFPAVGYRHLSDGTLYGAGAYGEYWSSVVYDSGSAYILWFLSSNLTVSNLDKRYGLSVRCVR